MALTKVTGGGIKDGTITNDDISSTTVIGKSKLAVTPVATGSVSGLMSSTHKGKLDGIADNANNYTKPANEAISYITGLQSAINAKVSSVAGKSLITDSVLAQLLLDVTALETLVISDTSNLNTLQEIVDFIELNKATLDTLGIANIAGLQNALDAKLSLTGGTMTGALTVNGNIRSNYLRVIKTGTNNTTQLTFNAPQTTVGTDTYSPSYFGGASAGMTVIKMPSGGEGGLQFYVKKHGTTGGSHDLSTFTNAFTIKDTGNVGIGTSSPSVGLQVGNNTLGETKLVIFNSEGGGPDGLTVKSRTNRAKLRVADNDTSAYVVAEGGISSFGPQPSSNAKNINITSAGNVGIGTTSPSHPLDVYASGTAGIRVDAGNGWSNLHLKSSSPAGGGGSIYFENNSGTNIAQIFAYQNYSSPYMSLYVNNDEKMRIDSAGNVGIGTNNPVAPLEIESTTPWVKLKDSDTGNSGSIEQSGTHLYIATSSSTGNIYFKNNNSNAGAPSINGDHLMTILDGGKVGIGTSSPDAELHIEPVGSNASLLLSNNGRTQYWRIQNNEADDALVFNANDASERMRITSTGSVCIGSTIPNATLDVQNTTSTSSIASFGGSSQTSYSKVDFRTDTINATQAFHIAYGSANPENLNFAMKNTSGDLFFVSSGIETMRMKSGNVGIGTTTPTSLLTVNHASAGVNLFELKYNNTARLTIDVDGTWNNIRGQSGQGFKFTTTGGALMVVGNSGNVGVGTSSPVGKLSVDGVGRGGNDILLLVGQGGNGSIRVRHIEGKNSPSDSPSGLYLNHYGPGEVSMCNGGGSVGIGVAPNERLTVSGNIVATSHIYANNKSQIITSPWYNFGNNTGGSARLSTPIVHNESNMFYIKVTGFGYGSGGRNQEYLFSGYAYSGSTLIAQGANTTTGNNGCSIGTEVRNGTTYIYIQISNGAQYYNHYKFEYTGWGAKNVHEFTWSKV